MNDGCGPESVAEVLDCVEDAAQGTDRVTVEAVIDRIGGDAFPPLILLPALLMVSPLTAIFGVATVCAVAIALASIQMIMAREKLWLPKFILRADISSQKINRIIAWLERPARVVDGVIDRRLTTLVASPFDRLWALLCLLLALVVPALELVPLSATIVAAAISLFALAMLARDGLLALVGLLVLGGAGWLVWSVVT
ncbi:exopolysaccharide biosynthesis protein [Aquamicrobium zhengzhouense]|uniref:Exopolysaccharide biosynthesis protein n=1 Tax=Aquamicrobium zhengzhouense TaxID=2781738 RepID=A0ABS0S9M9_9HYPH|nr:exopolysaccharide biosynthesis protein [Aquamicrobium zhengzhouense]MBI1619936.1 exopolysaccharide biosynthesis protein [Aquamicrobium zhengzhouense]